MFFHQNIDYYNMKFYNIGPWGRFARHFANTALVISIGILMQFNFASRPSSALHRQHHQCCCFSSKHRGIQSGVNIIKLFSLPHIFWLNK